MKAAIDTLRYYTTKRKRLRKTEKAVKKSSESWILKNTFVIFNETLRNMKRAEIYKKMISQIQLIRYKQGKFKRNLDRLVYLRKKVKSTTQKPARGCFVQRAVDQGEIEYLEDVCNRYLSGSESRKNKLEELHHR